MRKYEYGDIAKVQHAARAEMVKLSNSGERAVAWEKIPLEDRVSLAARAVDQHNYIKREKDNKFPYPVQNIFDSLDLGIVRAFHNESAIKE